MAVNNGDVLKVVMEVLLGDGSIAQNVYYFIAELLAQLGDATVTGLIETWIESAYGELTNELVNDISQRLCTVQKIEFDATEQEWLVTENIGTFTPTIVYGNANEALPNMVCAVATFLTFRPKTRGRKFLFPFGENDQDAGYLTSTALANMADYADAILDTITYSPGNDLEPGVPRAGVDNFRKLTGAVVTNVLGTQRRRRPGVGE